MNDGIIHGPSDRSEARDETRTDSLAAALRELLRTESAGEIEALARLLGAAREGRNISYEEAEKSIGGDPEDVLLLANEWRMLLPVRSSKSSSWEDRILLPMEGEKFEMPNVVRYLVDIASRTGHWDAKQAVLFVCRGRKNLYADRFVSLHSDKIPEVVKILGGKAAHHKVNVAHLKESAVEAGLGKDVVQEGVIDGLVSGFKACGIMSPSLGALTEASRTGSPIYELNPSLLGEAG